MKDQERESWAKAVVAGDGMLPDLAQLNTQQLSELEAKIAAEREQRQQRFIAEAATLGLRLTPRRHKTRRRRPANSAEAQAANPPQTQHDNERTAL